MKADLFPKVSRRSLSTTDEYRKLLKIINGRFHSRFFRLPSPYDIHEYSIVERFIESLPEGAIQDRLENAIRDRGAFRRFKDDIYLRYSGKQA